MRIQVSIYVCISFSSSFSYSCLDKLTVNHIFALVFRIYAYLCLDKLTVNRNYEIKARTLFPR